MSELATSLALSWHVVVRNWTVYRKDFLANISPTLADPALMLTALGMGLSPFIGQIHGLSYAQYLAPGMVATTALFTAFFECSYGFYVRMTFESVYKVGPTDLVRVPWRLIGLGRLGELIPAARPGAPDRLAGLLDTTALDIEHAFHMALKLVRSRLDRPGYGPESA